MVVPVPELSGQLSQVSVSCVVAALYLPSMHAVHNTDEGDADFQVPLAQGVTVDPEPV